MNVALHNEFKPIWHGEGHFYPLVLVGSDYGSLIFFKIFQTFSEVKIYVNLVF